MTVLLLTSTVDAATEPHVINFGKWTTVKWLTGPDDSQLIDLKTRPLYIDGRVKEFTLGIPHDITDRLVCGAARLPA